AARLRPQDEPEGGRRGGAVVRVAFEVEVARPARRSRQRTSRAAAQEPGHPGPLQPHGHGDQRGEQPRRQPGGGLYTGRVSDGRFYIPTPIYYVNGEPHIGHAY